jgi:hypothetical protein
LSNDFSGCGLGFVLLINLKPHLVSIEKKDFQELIRTCDEEDQSEHCVDLGHRASDPLVLERVARHDVTNHELQHSTVRNVRYALDHLEGDEQPDGGAAETSLCVSTFPILVPSLSW